MKSLLFRTNLLLFRIEAGKILKTRYCLHKESVPMQKTLHTPLQGQGRHFGAMDVSSLRDFGRSTAPSVP